MSERENEARKRPKFLRAQLFINLFNIKLRIYLEASSCCLVTALKKEKIIINLSQNRRVCNILMVLHYFARNNEMKRPKG